MVFVQRNNGVICGLYNVAQYEADGVTPIATEELPDDNAEVIAYRNPPKGLPDLLPYQFRAMLALSGHQSALDAYIAALPDPQKTIAQAKLDYSLAFERNNSLVLAAQQALGLTDDQLNALWQQAAAIT